MGIFGVELQESSGDSKLEVFLHPKLGYPELDGAKTEKTVSSAMCFWHRSVVISSQFLVIFLFQFFRTTLNVFGEMVKHQGFFKHVPSIFFEKGLVVG